jgi:hypothetical protein
MKKVIAAAAGLMLVGAMVGTASAAVSIKGDARARFYFQSNYDLGQTENVEDADGNVIGTQRKDEKNNKVASRVRVEFRGEAAGGAYAVGRIGIGNGTWDGGASTTDVETLDKGYIGVPMGMTLLEAGILPTQGLESTKFFQQDVTRDGLSFYIMPSDMAKITLGYYVDYEAAANGDLVNDNDITQWALWAESKFAGDWATRLGIMYEDNQLVDNDDADGAYGGIEFMGPAGPVALSGALAFDDRNVDTGYGGFLKGMMNFGAASAGLNVGFTSDGFVTDGDFGFIMLGGGQSISPSNLILGKQGDTFWIGVPISFAVSEMLTLQANLAYADFDNNGDGFEISGSAIYAISDGCSVDLDVGYFAWSAPDEVQNEEDPFGAGLTFNVSF